MWYFTVCAMGESFNYILIHMRKPQHWRHITAKTVSQVKTYTQTCSITIKLLYRCLSLPLNTYITQQVCFLSGGKQISMSSLSTSKSGPALVPKHREGFQPRYDTRDEDYLCFCFLQHVHACICMHVASL